ncbi:Coiled-coil domain-containing protein 9 [Holothuria leucospilota]|uniref:Coiled-coil domain-containing protein 9 n=1 Tax=Holothuria leucospilota TaxID=206669 RepID=A0A9Q1CK57_HOLLE|nr:Coiled-coil domain-containing protein 9 [Holothuria leucospilota]
MADSLLVSHTQLTQKLTEIVDNFTLLDILSKEEQEELLNEKIDKIKSENEKRLLRHQEVEADRELATRRMSSSEQDIKPHREQQVLERQSSSDSSKKSQKSSPPSRGSGKGGRGPPKGRQSSSPRSPASSTTSSTSDAKMPSSYNRRQVSSPVEPVPGMLQPNTFDVVLENQGTGLGFGIVGTPAGVSVKTVIPGGAAAMEGTLRTGDTLLFVNDVDVRCMRRDEVYDILRKESGSIHLVVSRDDDQHLPGRGQSSRRNDNFNQRGGYSRMSDTDRKENLSITIRNDLQEFKEESCVRTVHSGGKHNETLTVSIPNEKAQGFGGVGRGRGRGRGRGKVVDQERNDRSVRLTAEQMRVQDYEEKRKQNYDLVEAEIRAMREAYESQKAAEEGAASALPPMDPPSSGSFLYDRSRFGDGNQNSGPQDRREGRRRNPHNWGGPTIEDVHQNMNRNRRGRHHQSSGSHQSRSDMTTSMTGKERKDYEQWKNDRDRVDQERLARHVNASGEWRREWDREKSSLPGYASNQFQTKYTEE